MARSKAVARKPGSVKVNETVVKGKLIVVSRLGFIVDVDKSSLPSVPYRLFAFSIVPQKPS